ncbi:acetyl-coenzyme A synthetase, partial [Candidatus Aerophobetes bacterium]
MSKKLIETLFQEERVFPPPESFRSSAHIQSDRVYEEAKRDSEGFWASAAEGLHWFRRWNKVLEWTP